MVLSRASRLRMREVCVLASVDQEAEKRAHQTLVQVHLCFSHEVDHLREGLSEGVARHLAQAAVVAARQA